jgi:hypothetical protein
LLQSVQGYFAEGFCRFASGDGETEGVKDLFFGGRPRLAVRGDDM